MIILSEAFVLAVVAAALAIYQFGKRVSRDIQCLGGPRDRPGDWLKIA